MKLRAKLILLIALITAGMSFLTAYLVADHVEQDALHRAETLTAEHIAVKAREVLTVENFQSQDFQLQRPVFEAFLQQVRRSRSSIPSLTSYSPPHPPTSAPRPTVQSTGDRCRKGRFYQLSSSPLPRRRTSNCKAIAS